MKFSLKYRGVGHYVFFCINSTSGYTCSYPMIVNGWPQSHHKSINPPELPPPSPMMINNKLSQEPIIRSFYLSYLHSESTLFRIFLLLELRYVKGEGGIFFNFLRKHADVRIIAQKNGKLSALFTVIFSPLRTIFFSRRY